MRIAFTTQGTDWDSRMDARFGRTEYLFVYDDETEKIDYFDNRESADKVHGAGPYTATNLFKFTPDILITGNGPGKNATSALRQLKLKTYVGAGEMTIKEAYEAYKKSTLPEF